MGTWRGTGEGSPPVNASRNSVKIIYFPLTDIYRCRTRSWPDTEDQRRTSPVRFAAYRSGRGEGGLAVELPGRRAPWPVRARCQVSRHPRRADRRRWRTPCAMRARCSPAGRCLDPQVPSDRSSPPLPRARQDRLRRAQLRGSLAGERLHPADLSDHLRAIRLEPDRPWRVLSCEPAALGCSSTTRARWSPSSAGAGGTFRKQRALNHVLGYSIFNDASIRDFQTKSPQWTVGKNFDGTGAFGPVFVTADELPTSEARA